MGDTQPLANGNTFIGWGSEPYFTEYGPSGKRLLEARFPGNDLSYRSMREPWVGEPLTSPSAVASQKNGRTTVYVSWNGATQAVSWRVLATEGTHRTTVVPSSAKTGFQTAIPVPGSYKSLEVQALDSAGKVIGTSSPFSGSTQ
jgi:hypothetical protein